MLAKIKHRKGTYVSDAVDVDRKFAEKVDDRARASREGEEKNEWGEKD